MTPAATHDVFWSGLEAAVAGGLSFVSAFVIARLIGPGELGIAAAAVALHVMLWVGVNALFADALVQREAVDDAMAASAFWASVAIGGLCAVLQAGAGWLVAASLGDSRLIAMSALLALPLPLVGAGGVVQGLLTRRRAYRVLAGRAIIGQGLGTAAGIAAALAGAGAWAPVLQQFVTSAAGALVLLLRAGWRPRAVWHSRKVRALLHVGVPLTASTLVLTARYRLFALLLGGTAGAATLGETHMAFRLVDTARELCSTALWRLMLPVLAKRQHDDLVLRATVDRLLAKSSMAMLPLCGAMALALPQVVRRLLGPAWSTSAVAAEPLVALMAVLMLMFPAGVAVVARGRAGRVLLGNGASLLFTLVGVAWLRPAGAVQAVLVWCGAQLLVVPYALWMNGRAVGTGPLRPLRAGLAMAGITLAGLAAAATMPAAIREAAGPVAQVLLRLAVFGGFVVTGMAMGGRAKSGWPLSVRHGGPAGPSVQGQVTPATGEGP
ncbi:MAG TPA: oligosaccharide flippase family protein [Acetobacteraceae bacterium]|nr:oligosaccharide flippase family protein [Acetobacteraceae bacterium]